MKKFLAIILMVVMVCAMTLSVSAAPGGFIQSPSLNKAPILVEYYNSDGECIGVLYITSYADRNVLELSEREIIESAYESIRNTNSVSSLNSQLSDIAANLNVSAGNLAISDLFNLSMEDCPLHDDHGYFSIKLQADTLEHFVSLMYFEDGKWHIVDDAKIDGEYLTFTTDVPRALAIVVDVDDSVIDVPVTGDIIPWMLMALMAISAVGIIILVISYKKKGRA